LSDTTHKGMAKSIYNGSFQIKPLPFHLGAGSYFLHAKLCAQLQPHFSKACTYFPPNTWGLFISETKRRLTYGVTERTNDALVL
jgi:hypothetical protein